MWDERILGDRLEYAFFFLLIKRYSKSSWHENE